MTITDLSHRDLMQAITRDPAAALALWHKGAADAARANLPGHMLPGLARYVLLGIAPGSFLRAVIANDLIHATRRADLANFDALGWWAQWIGDFAPPGCVGSEAAMAAWVDKGGVRGRPEGGEV